MSNLLDELKWRGLVAQTTEEEALRDHLAAGPVNFYVGFDPSAASIHIGNLVQIILAKRLQEAGHHPFLLVGGATGMIGDPRQVGERVMNPEETVREWTEKIRAQVSRFLDFEGPHAARVVNNYDWTSTMNVIEFLRDIGKHFPVNRMLAREVVRSRLESGISYTEFSYVLLQSMDYRHLHREYGVTLQTGGNDQWGNLTAGVELIRRSDGAHVHAMSTPLITKADGSKFGKSEGGAIWLDADMLSPYSFHQFFLNAEDEKVIDYVKVFTSRGPDEIAELEDSLAREPWKRAAQHVLADDVTTLVHGEAETRKAIAAADAVFGRSDLAELDARTLEAVLGDISLNELPTGDQLPAVVDVLEAAGVVASKSAARRAINEGGAYINNVKVTDAEARLTEPDLLHGSYVVARRGKKTIGGVAVKRS
ncbi:tyrosine--tRNA ligase [Raineyella fluvialis]|uniref:Tyrosine--tRNA ligase n=1 Tax=Raineyella fluvialis TaxID=2662261 RepID=A0A5Q2FDL0_9ACTN|nr:tyrosine--tRNA ligase [Raineyella fluvialis]QGF24858.1 tyrosine--tRNA ligase [Raineyella fluvialis]